MKRTERKGAILVVAAKPRIQTSLRAALTAPYGRILTAESVQEAQTLIGRENVSLMLLFSPLKDEEEAPRLLDMADRRDVMSLLVVGKEIYQEVVYRLEGRNAIVATYPLQMDQVLQLIRFLSQMQDRLRLIQSERERMFVSWGTRIRSSRASQRRSSSRSRSPLPGMLPSPRQRSSQGSRGHLEAGGREPGLKGPAEKQKYG